MAYLAQKRTMMTNTPHKKVAKRHLESVLCPLSSVLCFLSSVLCPRRIKIILALFFCCFAIHAMATVPSKDTKPLTWHNLDTDDKKWAALVYAGRSCKEPLVRILKGNFTSTNETLLSAELAYQLAPENPVRHFFHYISNTAQVAGNITRRDGVNNQGMIWEFDPYFALRWEHFPWNTYIDTTVAVGEGISYVTRVPWVEQNYNDDVAHLLNYLMFETTFALPSHPEWQLVARIHHRSGAFGLYGAGNTGSNAVGLGIRYCFG